MTILEKHTLRFWTSMLKMNGPLLLSQGVARNSELPDLMATTPFDRIRNRIAKELSHDNENNLKQSS